MIIYTYARGVVMRERLFSALYHRPPGLCTLSSAPPLYVQGKGSEIPHGGAPGALNIVMDIQMEFIAYPPLIDK